ncbi:MAG: putative small lipoprotein YifL [Bacteroidia bacterium]|jgi:predicted small lipoprotein YifL
MPSALNRLFLALALAAPLATLVGCGQMGPLYLPAEEPAADEVEATADATLPDMPLPDSPLPNTEER